MNLNSIHDALRAFKAIVLLGFTALIAPIMAAAYLPLTRDALLNMALWFLVIFAIGGSHVALAVQWHRRHGALDAEGVSDVAMETLALIGGACFGLMMCIAAGQSAQTELLGKKTLICGVLGLAGVGSSFWSALRAVRYARALRGG